MLGHDVVVFEARPKAGGLNEYGIAKFKLPGEFAQQEVDFLLSVGGIDIQYGQALGENLQLRDLIHAGRAKPSFIVSHELKLEQAPDAYQHFDQRDHGWTKVILHPGD